MKAIAHIFTRLLSSLRTHFLTRNICPLPLLLTTQDWEDAFDEAMRNL